MEMWGGVECTVNRVGDRYFDQLARTGHMGRVHDLDRIADLGIRALRFPLLWEHVQPERGAAPNWSWVDRALARLRGRGVRPIVGLLHHGFGPRWIDVRDPAFVDEFGGYARMVAERYPWVESYTPMNEPLTTARFSAMYGHWNPHARDDATFARILVTQLAAIAHAMREIRAVNPRAKLVQTEDLGQITSTPALAYQRDFENERRWLTWDGLHGRITPEHPCWSYLCDVGGVGRELEALHDAPCPPDVIGINHYITSERYLDDRVERYALDEIGGNGRDVYADVAQVQVDATCRVGVYTLLRQAWARYRRPTAVTECHLGCTREEQMRWLRDVWDAAQKARDDGIDVRAVTSWALLGSYDWDSLVTRESGHYEPGAFDARSNPPRATALATMIRALATNGVHSHPVLDAPGWWQRPSAPANAHSIAIVGAHGQLGRALAAACECRGLAYVAIDGDRPRSWLDLLRPWAVVDVNGDEAALSELAHECAARGIRLAALQSAEQSHTCEPTRSFLPEVLRIRGGEWFGAADDDPIVRALVTLAGAEPFEASDVPMRAPTFIPDLMHVSLDLLIDDESGSWNLSHETTLTPFELIARVAKRVGVSTERLARAPSRPPSNADASHRTPADGRALFLPPLDRALDRLAAAVRLRIDAVARRPPNERAVAGVLG
jgi:dTDP-4-dehydrorhamnose reductase